MSYSISTYTIGRDGKFGLVQDKERIVKWHPKLIKKDDFLNDKTLSVTAPLVLGVVGSNGGIFWETFLKYIFPWLLDIAQVYCAIMIAQGFYQENRGGRDSGSGMSNMLKYGKWLILFHLMPWGVELIDQIGSTMYNELSKK